MSAGAANAVSSDRPDRAGGEVVVRLVPKMAAIEAALAACKAGDCQPQDVAVVAYIVSAIDRRTGECVRHYQTIADGCGTGRAAVGRSIKRLADAGVIERAARFARNRSQIATAFTIGGPILDTIAQRTSRSPRPASETPPSRERDTYSPSHCSLYPGVPDREKEARQAGTRDSPSEAVQASMAARIVERSNAGGSNYHDLKSAHDDLRSWASCKGWQAITAALGRAESVGPNGRGLRGAAFIDFMESTIAGRGSGDQSQRTATPPGRPTALAGDTAAQDRRRVGGAGSRGRERRCA